MTRDEAEGHELLVRPQDAWLQEAHDTTSTTQDEAEAHELLELPQYAWLHEAHGTTGTTQDEAGIHELQILPLDIPVYNAPATSHSSSAEGDVEPASTQLWLPMLLKRFSLAGFLTCFLAIAIILPVLYAVSERRKGLSTANSRHHYGWTYGPTAVFTLIAVAWSQLEYRYKQLMPWEVMQTSNGYAPASNSVLLDYVSPWNVRVLYTAIKEGHWAVALPVAGSLLLTLMIIISTGLFSLQDATVSNSVPMTLQESFHTSGRELNWTVRISDVPWTMSYGAQYMNLTLPYGTTEQYLFPRFNISTKANIAYSPNNIMEATMDVFAFDVPCERANVVLGAQQYSGQNWLTNVTLSTPSCSLKKSMQLAGPNFGVGNARGLFDTWTGNCSEDLSVGALVRTNSSTGEPLLYSANRQNQTGQYQFAGIVCTPSYNISRASVSYRGLPGTANAEVKVTISPTTSTSRLPGLTNSRLMETIWRGGASIGIVNSLINATSADYVPIELSNITYLEGLVRSSHAIAGIQIVRETFLDQTGTTIDGVVTRVEPRLFVRTLSFALLEAAAGLLAVIAAIMIFLKPSRVCPRDPGSICGLAAILSRSHVFMRHLNNLGATRDADLRESCQGLTFRSAIHPSEAGKFSFEIHCRGENADMQTSPINPPARRQNLWWRPFPTSNTTRIVVLVLPILVIIVLEILHRKSQSHGGIAVVSTSNKYQRYAWVYIPALVMVTIRIIFDTTSFAIKVFEPYSNLRVGGYSSRKTLLLNQLGKPAIQTVWEAFKLRQIAIAAVSIAMLLAPFLTVAVSGLYTADVETTTRTFTVRQSSLWNTTFVKDGYLSQGIIRQSNFAHIVPGMYVSPIRCQFFTSLNFY